MDRNLRRIVTSSRELEVLPWYRFWKINTLEYPDLPLDVASARLKALLDSGNCPDFDCRFREENGFPTIHVITLNGFVPKFDIIQFLANRPDRGMQLEYVHSTAVLLYGVLCLLLLVWLYALYLLITAFSPLTLVSLLVVSGFLFLPVWVEAAVKKAALRKMDRLVRSCLL